ncbi:MAG: hypothetical protein H6581_07995 [Bacteroidia bacterium]|nr:hypothetical protein [Bacteroidia bacterium]
MRSPDSYIYDLVKSLSLGERDSFRYWVNSLPNYPIYAFLFDLIDSKFAYDEGEIKLEFCQSFPKVKFKRVKNQLKDVLFRILVRSYGSNERSPSEQFELIHCLKKRGLFQLARREIIFAKKGFWKEERFDRIIGLLEIQLDLYLEILPEDQFIPEREEIIKEILEAETLSKNLLAFKKANWDHYFQFKKKHYERGEIDLQFIESIDSLELFKSESSAMSNRAKREFYFQKARIENFKRNFESAFLYLNKLFALYESVPFLKAEFPKSYYMVISQITAFYCKDKNFAEAKIWLQKLDVKLTETPSLNLQVRELFLINSLNYSRLAGKYLGHLNQEISLFIKEIEGEPFSRFTYRLLLITAIQLFEEQDYQKAKKTLLIVLNKRDENNSLDLQCLSRIVELLFYLKLKDFQTLEYRMGSIQRFLKKHSLWGDMETIFFRFLRQIIHASDQNKQRELILKFYNYLEKNPDKNPYSIFFSFTDWFKTHHQLSQ